MTDGITTTFSDNTAVTAGDLNNIAIDLGKTDFAVFSSDEKFGNAKLNRITADLVSSGILNLNDRCKCTLTKDGSQISVTKGVAVFGDGSKIRINEVQTLDIIVGGTNYVYFKNDTITGKATLENSLTEPTTEYFVMLCTVTDGVLADARSYATIHSQIQPTAKAYKEISVSVTVTVPAEKYQAETLFDVDVGDFPYTRIFQKNGLSTFNIQTESGSVCDSQTNKIYKETSLLYRKNSSSSGSTNYDSISFISLSSSFLKLKAYVNVNSYTNNTNGISHLISCDFILV